MKEDYREVDEVLDNVVLPATASELAVAAEETGATNLTEFFESLNPDTQFDERSQVISAVSQIEAMPTATSETISDSELMDDEL